MKFRPLHDRVVIRRVDPEGKTTGGIIIPDTAQEKPMEGEIVAVGPGARDEKGTVVPLDVKKGDRILFGKWSGTEVKLDGEDLLIMNESDIMGVIERARRRQEEGGLTATGWKRPSIKNKEQEPWQQKKYVSAATPAPA